MRVRAKQAIFHGGIEAQTLQQLLRMRLVRDQQSAFHESSLQVLIPNDPADAGRCERIIGKPNSQHRLGNLLDNECAPVIREQKLAMGCGSTEGSGNVGPIICCHAPTPLLQCVAVESHRHR